MLAWLAAPSDAIRHTGARPTMADAPQTPAPVFAYRALRSIVFGETNEYDSDLSHSEKENAQTSGRRKTSRETPNLRKSKTPKEDRAMNDKAKKGTAVAMNSEATPTKAKSQSIRAAKQATAPMPSTPPRQPFRPLQSPAKSILKVSGPGAFPTPRRQGVSVSFTGVKRRASTESRDSPAGKGAAVTQKPQSTSGKKAETAEIKEVEKVGEAKDGPNAGTKASAIVDEAYVASTEREMKRLVRRGQQAREYANDLQQKMLDLRQELVEAKRENESLRRGLGSQVAKDGRYSSNGSRKEEEDGLFDLSPSIRMKHHQPQATDKSLEVRNEHCSAPKAKDTRIVNTARTPKPDSYAFDSAPIKKPNPTPSSRSIPGSRRKIQTQSRAQDTEQRRLTLLPNDRESAAQARIRSRREARKLVKQDRRIVGGTE